MMYSYVMIWICESGSKFRKCVSFGKVLIVAAQSTTENFILFKAKKNSQDDGIMIKTKRKEV